MLGDLTTPEDVERERRSVTMLGTGAPAYNCEEALSVLAALLTALADPGGQGRRHRPPGPPRGG